MQELRDIPGIGKASFELLEAAGFRDIRSLARADADLLVEELGRANEMIRAAKRIPARTNVEKWIAAAREALCPESNDGQPSDMQMPVNFEAMPEVAGMLSSAPCAIPFPGRWLAENGIPVEEIIPGILLNRYAGDLEIRIEDQPPEERRRNNPVRPSAKTYFRVAEKPQQSRLHIDLTRIRRLNEPLPPSDFAPHPGSDTNRAPATAAPPASKPKLSRRIVRGVAHSNPWSIRVGALITLPLFLLIPISIVVSVLLLLHDGDPEAYPWVRPWWVVFPFLVPVLGIVWLIWGHSCACRICRQKLFVPSNHQKNTRAHHLPLIGYILPLCLHLLLFNWFRCTHCGTPVSLKK